MAFTSIVAIAIVGSPLPLPPPEISVLSNASQIGIRELVIAVHVAEKLQIGIGQHMGGLEAAQIGQCDHHRLHVGAGDLPVEVEIFRDQVRCHEIRLTGRRFGAGPIGRRIAVNCRGIANKRISVLPIGRVGQGGVIP